MEVKEIKEAIMFLENTLYFCIGEEDDMPDYQSKYNHWIKEVIFLLQQLDKYRLMWEELESEIQVCALRKLFTKNIVFGYLLDKIKQKYFPKNEETDDKS